ncbi:ead/Ea22-like family protein [Klebsiella quasipneumoniae subsp. similipneumoniae]|uniref:ead/Ea22-like family protein n=1 Tax=Klebsiella quasipneumoniae TaxID=1463165 RepID=UPI002480AC02|nr:ead/Ea22-like family protein [Klebsiella quasipneumoniae]
MTDITELAQSLKAAAEKAGIEQWVNNHGEVNTADYEVDGGVYIDHICNCEIVGTESPLAEFIALANPANIIVLVEALEKAQQRIDSHREYYEGVIVDGGKRIAELESRTVNLPDGWQFEECEIEGCENGAIFSVGTGSRNIHLCDKCAHEPQNSRLKKSPLSKRLPFKMSAGIKVEAE